jgi:molecular chaperone HtpG
MVELTTRAEQYAKRAQDLPAFRDINLLGLKNKISELLDLIGRVEGIFSTYTRHDIVHIDQMNTMLEWLIPPETQKNMTPVDWLLTVMSIYLHDLGMFVTEEEFRDRNENAEFVQFVDSIANDPDGRDYLARTKEMSEVEQNRFFYQEFVRLHHATRIREWITGRHSRHWGQSISKIAEDVAKITAGLPSRFRENLAMVCESHHKDDLDETGLYPLAQRYGGDREEVANVQYAALLLRTTDLLHVTKDRTPSMTYRHINFSDLRSVDEWKRQKDTFSVHMRAREFNPNDEETHVIEISADFSEERPFFALSEYIAWANREMAYTRQCATKGQLQPDGKYYAFPWKLLRGDIRVEGNEPRQMRFELDRGRLLNLLVGHTIYNEPTVAIRELLQNSIDAVRFQKYQDAKNGQRSDEGNVIVSWNPVERILAISDNGTGMNLNTIQDHLLRVGSSFYDTPQFQSANGDFSPISRFGIGVLTCFMISDDVEIVTFRDNKGWRIRMSRVEADYLLKELAAGDPFLENLEPHGTRVTLKLRPLIDLSKRSILDIVKYWVLLPACKVVYTEGQEEATIGFTTAADALRALFKPTVSTSVAENYEVLTTDLDQMSGCELAFVVERSFTPERMFASARQKSAAATCIEGIRADNNIPGFRSELPALLSVRGNRRFRTTVSRSNLERDSEYERFAEICGATLFRHVGQEVQRISSSEGRPLSQASTLGMYVAQSLTAFSETDTRIRLGNLLRQIPLVVTEESKRSGGEISAGRDLRTIQEVAALPSFWTIESRTVDYLSTISRDLGTDISVTQFVASLAPTQFDERVTPLIPDIQKFVQYFLDSHEVERVEVSRRYQRTIMQWKLRSANSRSPDASVPQELVHSMNQMSTISQLDFLTGARYGQDDPPILARRTFVTAVSGDVTNVQMVHSRSVTVLDARWPLAIVWQALMDAYNDPGLTARERTAAIFGASTIARAGSESPYVRNAEDAADTAWLFLRDELLALLRKRNFQGEVPLNLDTKSIETFSAWKFWRDW